jgi:hypothetical protein
MCKGGGIDTVANPNDKSKMLAIDPLIQTKIQHKIPAQEPANDVARLQAVIDSEDATEIAKLIISLSMSIFLVQSKETFVILVKAINALGRLDVIRPLIEPKCTKYKLDLNENFS